MKANKKQLLLPIVSSSLAGLMIQLFLTGKIINYPKGTHEGGVIATVGVLVIIVSTVGIAWFIYWLWSWINREETT